MNEKKRYASAELTIMDFDSDDIIVTSPESPVNAGQSANGDIWETYQGGGSV